MIDPAKKYTWDGLPVTSILKQDLRHPKNCPIVIAYEYEGYEFVSTVREAELVEVKPEIEIRANIYKSTDGHYWGSFSSGIPVDGNGPNRVACVSIRFKEGEGL